MVSEDVKAYVSSLADLTFNSKPLINMLTMLADENVAHAAEIVEVVENHLTKVKTDVKLPILYLIDCIVKNVGGPYTELFSQNIVATFCSVFRVVDEKTRAEMFKLRQTWNDVFSAKKLYAIDVQIRLLDPAWPVTAPLPPSSSIHFNPKFLKNSASIPTPTKPNSVSSADPVTLDMQQQLIQKQKELIELQQKKVELELLQTKVRLREQINSGSVTGGATTPQNVLLKPEVAKQLLSPTSKTTLDTKNSSNSTRTTGDNSKSSATSGKNQRMQVHSANSGPRIQPVNSALVAAAVNRPIRDPRLLRQHQSELKQPQNTSNINVQLENKNTLESSNKIVNSKTSVRDIMNDPRLKNTNDNVPSQKFSDKPKSRILPKSRSDKNQVRTSRDKNHSDDSKSSKSSSNSSLESPKKSKSEKSSPSKSLSSRSRRRDGSGVSSSREPKISKSDTSLPIFKDIKGSKNRNYIRRNRSPEFSPEPSTQDIDLRLVGPPEKQPRIVSSSEKSVVPQIVRESSPPLIPPKDVDLRQIPSIRKKRPSVDSPEKPYNKKSKTEIFDVTSENTVDLMRRLFGNEDTDLRKLTAPAPERPPTPPPPIISSTEDVEETKKETLTQKSTLEAVRAKLAANLKKSSPPANKKTPADPDVRVNSKTELKNKILISQDEGEKIKEGAMTTIQQKKLMNKIIAQMEAHKLMEAKKKNPEETQGNVSLTPISDEEMEDFGENGNKNRSSPSIPPSSFGDKDERVIPMNVMSTDENFPKRFVRENRRGVPNWRGVRGRRHWESGPHPRAPLRPWLQPPMQQPPMNNWQSGNFRPPFPDVENDRRSPEGNDVLVESATQDDIKTITIDGLSRDIRYYDEVAIIFMNWDDPREISFQNGTRRVVFNDTDMYLMNFNEPYREYRIGESLHQVRLGGPSREIYIDYKPYECYFGGPGITIDLDGKVTTVKLDGPPPQVKIGESRTDLVAGKIKLIIDAKTIVPIFLDSKLQTFNFNGEEHTVQFNPGLKSVLINDENFDVQFGGLPKPVSLKGNRHYIRFSVLPKGLTPGHIKLKGLECDEATSSPRLEDVDTNEPVLPIPPRLTRPYDPNSSPDNSNSGSLFQNVLQQQNLNNLDFLTNVISSSEQTSNLNSSYQIENQPSQNVENNSKPPSNLFNMGSINDLFQKLVASGMVTTTSSTTASLPVREPPPHVQHHPKERTRHNKHFKKCPPLKPVSFDKPEQLKLRQMALFEKLYNGMQCSSCGMRFPPEQSMYYSQHLDWHFRQNRKGKKNARVANSRKWFYSLSDWQNYEEIENLEEREKNYFDQQQQAEGATEAPVEDTELPSVNADPELQDICDVCGDKFEIFFNEDKEEWQFKNAVRDDDKIYHPICHEEYQQSLLNQELEDQNGESIPGIEIVLDDEEDAEKPDEEMVVDEVILDESDESKANAEEDKKEDPPTEYEDEDDDVIIKEETIEQIILEDDDDERKDDEETEMNSITSTPIESPKIRQPEIIDDGFVDVNEGLRMLQNGGPIRVKTEPLDEDELMTDENAFEISGQEEPDKSLDISEEPKEPEMEPTHVTFVPSIDGNMEMDSSVPAPVSNVSGKIKINIHKPLPVITAKDSNKDLFSENDTLPETVIDPSQPLPPGEEPILLKLKPALQGIELKKMPPVQQGSELTGMCSIM